MSNLVNAERITMSFGTRTLLDGISLGLGRGEAPTAARFGPQLQVTIDATPEALAVRLPPFLVQPLVENAVKHGKTERPLGLLVRARTRRER